MSAVPTSHPPRDYGVLLDQFDPEPRLLPPQLREARMISVVDAAWQHLGTRGVSWLGFYLKDPRREQMVLGPRRDKPACSPIGLNGVCGRAWYEGRPTIVRDVAVLGSAYIACDPKDRSELVIPLFETDRISYGVLDLDSYDLESFHMADVIGLLTLLEHAGLSCCLPSPPPILTL
jgi:putative methionine-R-sulfoxide reductase with GAF domain